MSDKGEPRHTTVCEACGTAVPSYDVVRYGSIEGGYRELCTSCFNAEVAGALGMGHFEHVRLEPVVMTDCAGEQHCAGGTQIGWQPGTSSAVSNQRAGDPRANFLASPVC